ncbi:hypothetical protein FRC10_012277 [Ceratobasidium sp. 414]|nr:hypothetical protein FRC10_012277 [Ceratobasidium sp. 414]
MHLDSQVAPWGATPLAYEVSKNPPLELGMLELYVTNLPSEFGSVEHSSPFTFDEEGKRSNVKSTSVATGVAMRGSRRCDPICEDSTF